MKQSLQQAAMWAADALMAVLPRRLPPRAALEACRIISHRGEFDNREVFENTLAAFRAARDAGVWGIECDIRWTADQVPVIFHDMDGRRVFDVDRELDALTFRELRRLMPLVPSLEELVTQFGHNTHLMLEIKTQPGPEVPDRSRPDLSRPDRTRILQQQLAGLRAGEDYHFLALDPALLEPLDFVPPQCCLLVAETNIEAMSRAALARGLGGLTGHFLLLGNTLKAQHEAAGQRVGTGFIASRRCLYRELNRGVEWIFSNHAARIQGELDRALGGERRVE